MKRYAQGICAGLMLGGITAITGCAAPDAGGGVAVYYDYQYFPDCDAYYYPQGHIYYWNEGGSWHSGNQLPDRYHGQAQHAEQVHLRSQQPWTEHHVEQRAAAQQHNTEHH